MLYSLEILESLFRVKIFFCNTGISVQPTIKTANEASSDAIGILARIVNKVMLFQKFLGFTFNLNFLMRHNPFHKDILPFSIGSEISAWLGGSDLTAYAEIQRSAASCGRACETNPSTLRDPWLSITCLKPLPFQPRREQFVQALQDDIIPYLRPTAKCN